MGAEKVTENSGKAFLTKVAVRFLVALEELEVSENETACGFPVVPSLHFENSYPSSATAGAYSVNDFDLSVEDSLLVTVWELPAYVLASDA
jgi:hypothetical protein